MRAIILILLTLGCVINGLNAQNDTLYYEDFSDSTLMNWTVIDSTNRGNNWIWTKTYPSGHWRPLTSSLISPSSSNGFICFPADFYNTPYNPPTSGIDTMDAWISSDAIPIIPSSQVEVQFRQFLSFCCRSYGITSGIQLQVSSDSLNWTPFDVTSLNARSGSTANSELQIHNVSSVLMGEDTAYIRFRFSKNGWYYWMVDDVYIFGSIITSTDELSARNPVNLYPNPTNGILNLDLGETQFQNLEIRNTLGALVYQNNIIGQRMELNLNHLEKGLYFISLIGENSREVKKIILQ